MSNTEQTQPVQAGSDDAHIDEKLRGILLQLAADHDSRPDEDLEAVLTKRLKDSDISLSTETVASLARKIPGLTRADGTDLQPGVH
ncbi:hypothetical protein HQQ80_03525 [Microbacteriaceae bacterium VKM Ac-2855]|nr:hypothetical protein [Microbacteriaceae bacterium VKM Ac-2855]